MQKTISKPANDHHVPSRLERVMKRVVIILGVILFFGFIGLIATIAYRIANPEVKDKSAAEAIVATQLDGNWVEQVNVIRPAGAELVGVTGDGPLLYLHFRSAAGGDQIIIVDSRSGTVRSTVIVTEP